MLSVFTLSKLRFEVEMLLLFVKESIWFAVVTADTISVKEFCTNELNISFLTTCKNTSFPGIFQFVETSLVVGTDYCCYYWTTVNVFQIS